VGALVWIESSPVILKLWDLRGGAWWCVVVRGGAWWCLQPSNFEQLSLPGATTGPLRILVGRKHEKKHETA
jgi:hypothetical protein